MVQSNLVVAPKVGEKASSHLTPLHAPEYDSIIVDKNKINHSNTHKKDTNFIFLEPWVPEEAWGWVGAGASSRARNVVLLPCSASQRSSFLSK